MRVLLLSDVHGNYDALSAVFERFPRFDEVWVLGDLVDYGPEPHLVVDAVRSLDPDVVVMGNHDAAVAFGVDCRCGEEMRDVSVYTRNAVSLRLLGNDQVRWLRGLRASVDVTLGGRKGLLVHGSPRNPLYEYMHPSLGPQALAEMVRPRSWNLVLVGHTHVPMDVVVEGVRVLNPGSVGQPRDGDPRASFAILDTETLRFEVHRVEYDVGRVVSKLRSLGLEERCLEKLALVLSRGGQVR